MYVHQTNASACGTQKRESDWLLSVPVVKDGCSHLICLLGTNQTQVHYKISMCSDFQTSQGQVRHELTVDGTSLERNSKNHTQQ